MRANTLEAQDKRRGERMEDRARWNEDSRPGGGVRPADGGVPGSPRPWPRHLTGGHELPRRRVGRDGRGRTGPWRVSFAERVSAGQAGLKSFWTLQGPPAPGAKQGFLGEVLGGL